MAPALVNTDDVVEIDLDGRDIGQSGKNIFLERFIHAEIYRSRPDVMAIVHSHAMEVLPFSVVASVRVQPICHVCGFLRKTPTPFEIEDYAGPGTDLLIRNSELGKALANHLGSSSVVLMRGHGFTAVGDGIPEATFRAIYAVRNCKIQISATLLGEPKFLSDTEAIACDVTTKEQSVRAWELWQSELKNQASAP